MSPFPLLLLLAADPSLSPMYNDTRALDFWPWPYYFSRLNTAVQPKDFAVPHIGKDGFQVRMDVSQFKPNELDVKVVEDSIVVEGKHEEREDDHGYISRQFIRRYAIPRGYDPEKVSSTLSSDGVLTVSIPKPEGIDDKTKERHVQIQQTGPARENVTENPQDDKVNNDKVKDDKEKESKNKEDKNK